MQTLQLDPPIPYLLPIRDRMLICLIGCGGTGSHLAQSLARIAAHLTTTGGPQLDLVFVDGDVVEAKNVGRQLFSPADIGQNKALAARFGAVFGLPIIAIPTMASAEVLRSVAAHGNGLLLGAVDSADGRKVIHKALSDRGAWRLWIDCGNHEHSGQVAVGTTTQRERLSGAFALPGLCSALPAPSPVYPKLLKAAPKRRRADCAAAMEDNVQSLMVNQAVAAIAAEYVYQIVINHRLTTFCTTFDLQSLSMRSLPITAQQVAAATGVSVADLCGEPSMKGQAA
jgi:PRTRC genetic system ThiF family protein